MTRNDKHRPSAIVPEDYSFVGFEYLRTDGIGDALFLQSERQRIAAHKHVTGGDKSRHTHGGNCDICGSVNAIYKALFWHKPSNTYISTGLDCAEKLECHGIEAFRKNVANAREQAAGKRKAEAILTDAGLADVWAVYVAVQKQASEAGREETIITDIVNKLVRYGSISPAQTNFLRKLVGDIATRAERLAARAAERELAQPVPAGKMTVRGTVTGFKTNEWGASMIVKHADGWVVMGTVPAAIKDAVQKGSAVEFSATVAASRNDPKFGYFSRPAKAKVL